MHPQHSKRTKKERKRGNPSMDLTATEAPFFPLLEKDPMKKLKKLKKEGGGGVPFFVRDVENS
jgi:hypothetical protein